MSGEFERLKQIHTEAVHRSEHEFERYRSEVIESFLAIITDDTIVGGSFELLKMKEDSIYRLSEIFARLERPDDMMRLARTVRPLFTHFPKVTTAKIVRTVIENLGEIPNSLEQQISLCRDSVEWAVAEKRTFLKQRIEARLAGLLYEKREFEVALQTLTRLITEVRRLDDKSLLVEVFLLESKIQFSLKNVPKAKSSLVAARNAGQKIYIPPKLQGELDTQSGIVYSAERDFTTGFSYFFEAFEAFQKLQDPRAVKCLKYMLLSKVMLGLSEDILSILSSKITLPFAPEIDIEAIRAVSVAHQHQSLHEFQDALRKFRVQIVDDPIVATHIDDLYEDLFEQHLLRIIRPFSRVQISHVASLINLDRKKVERKLSLMILDRKLSGILDQGADCLITFEDHEEGDLLETALTSLDRMTVVVDSLFNRAKKLEQEQ